MSYLLSKSSGVDVNWPWAARNRLEGMLMWTCLRTAGGISTENVWINVHVIIRAPCFKEAPFLPSYWGLQLLNVNLILPSACLFTLVYPKTNGRADNEERQGFNLSKWLSVFCSSLRLRAQDVVVIIIRVAVAVQVKKTTTGEELLTRPDFPCSYSLCFRGFLPHPL